MGKQKIGAVVYCIGYYVIGLPLAVILMFVAKFGVLGLWYGMTVGAFVPAFFLTIYILRTNWNTLKEEAEERTGLKQKPASLKCVYTHSSEEEDNRSRILFFESVPNGQPSDQQPVNDLSSPLDATKSDFLPMKTLILRRGLLVMAAVVLLVIGVLVRVWLVHL
ncbi:multidrug and toxin extrusion protein 2-like [Pleurodeles waltl]|uniref:multidrug and toxin extrusion protein 2-like n=1 Tax=Pleurodeles waltl TaxID=8319 RepID=UPI00370980AE